MNLNFFKNYLIHKASGFMDLAGHTIEWIINDDLQGTMIALGRGDLVSGVVRAAKIAQNNRHGLFNMFLMAGTDTVGADTNINVLFHTYQPVAVGRIIYKNSATDTGTFTGIKINGELIMPSGWTSTQAGNPEWADLDSDFAQTGKYLFFIPADAEVEVTGNATNADVVDITIEGIDLTPQLVG